MPSSDYRFNFYREKHMQEKVLLVSMVGTHVFLDKEEYYSMKCNKIGDELHAKLEDAGIIITDSNENKLIGTFRGKKKQLFQGTALHIVVVTLRCNENCIYCQAASRPETDKEYDMSIETARKTVDFIFQTPAKKITIEFQGGEPLLNFEVVKEIILYAKEKNKTAKKELRFSLVTNLSLMDDEKLKFLIDNRINICTSLDGPKSIHDKNRPMSKGSSYDLTIKWIERIMKKKNMNALMSTTKHSLGHAKDIVDEYIHQGFKSIWIRPLNNLGKATPLWKEIGYNADEFLTFWKEAVDYVYQTKKIRERSLDIFLQKIIGEKDPMMVDLMSPCGAAIGQMAYNYDGRIFTCDEGRMLAEDIFEIGTVRDNSYKDVFSSPKTKSIVSASINEAHFCDTCVYQPYCGLCPVCSYANSGNLMPRLAQDQRCKILMGQFDYLFNKLAFDRDFEEYARKIIKDKI
jgi:uncharacterized protein